MKIGNLCFVRINPWSKKYKIAVIVDKWSTDLSKHGISGICTGWTVAFFNIDNSNNRYKYALSEVKEL